jgi:imidazolonepropionase
MAARAKKSKKTNAKTAKQSTRVNGAKAKSGRTKSAPRARLFRRIGELYTLAGAAAKGGRRTNESDLTCITRAAMIEQGGRIVWAGPEKSLPSALLKGLKVEEQSFEGAVVIPALAECHTHLVFAGNRAKEFELRNQGVGYQEIARQGGGILSTVRATREASLQELVIEAQARADRFVSQGVTTIEAKSGYGLDAESEIKMLRAAGRIKGPRVIRTFLGAHAIPPEAESAEAYVEKLMREVLPRVRDEKLATRVDIFTEQGYFSTELSRLYLSHAKSLGFDLAVHADQLTRSGGAQLAVELGARSAEHLININSFDREALAGSEVTSVLLPSADLYMKCAYPPARELIDAGARVALATDFNPGTSPSPDVALVGVLARVMMKMTLAETLVAYTVGACHALGLELDLGSLEAGKVCDFAVLSGGFEELFLEIGRMPISRVYRRGECLSEAAARA